MFSRHLFFALAINPESGKMAFVIKTIRITVPQVAVLLETSHGVSRMELQGILKFSIVCI